jgi:hypothetical protein
MTDHRDPDTIPLSERIETAVSNHVLRACYIEMAKRLEALETHLINAQARLIETNDALFQLREVVEEFRERERASGGRPKKEAA